MSKGERDLRRWTPDLVCGSKPPIKVPGMPHASRRMARPAPRHHDEETMMDRNGTTHPRCPDCGTIWRQSGNRTGHCSQCCRTFQGQAAFDKHQTHPDGERVRCLNPATIQNTDGALTFTSTTGTTPLDLGTVYWSLSQTDEKREYFRALKDHRSRQ